MPLGVELEGQKSRGTEQTRGEAHERSKGEEEQEAAIELEHERLAGWQPLAALLERVMPVVVVAGRRRAGVGTRQRMGAMGAAGQRLGVAGEAGQRVGDASAAGQGTEAAIWRQPIGIGRKKAKASKDKGNVIEDRTETIDEDRDRVGTWFPKTGIG